MEGGPPAVSIAVGFNQFSGRVDFGVHVVEVVQDDGFDRHGDFGAAVIELSMVADDHVLQAP